MQHFSSSWIPASVCDFEIAQRVVEVVAVDVVVERAEMAAEVVVEMADEVVVPVGEELDRKRARTEWVPDAVADTGAAEDKA